MPEDAMFAIADTKTLVTDEGITHDQATEIEHRARELLSATGRNG